MDEARRSASRRTSTTRSRSTPRSAVTEGINEIVKTLCRGAGRSCILVVFIFLQGWRATLIPLLAVPVSLIGTFAFFPLLGFSINTLSLFGLVLAIGLVVDDAIVVVEAVERHIEKGLSPQRGDAQGDGGGVRARSSPSRSSSRAVFVPTVFIPGITGRLYQQFAVTIAISVLISAFNALTLSARRSRRCCCGRSAPSRAGRSAGSSAAFNRMFDACDRAATSRRLRAALIRKTLVSAGRARRRRRGRRRHRLAGCPAASSRSEDQGYFFMQRPAAGRRRRSQRTDDVVQRDRGDPREDAGRGVRTRRSPATACSSSVTTHATTGSSSSRSSRGTSARRPRRSTTAMLAQRSTASSQRDPRAMAFAFSPPAIPGVGTAGGVTFMLAGPQPARTSAFLADERATLPWQPRSKRPEFDAGVHDVPCRRCRRSSWTSTATRRCKQGVDAGGRLHDAADLHGRRVRELLQPLRAARGRSTCRPKASTARGRRPRPVLRAERRRASMVPLSALVEARADAAGPSSRCASTCTAVGADQRLAARGLQLRPGDEGARGGRSTRPCRPRWATTTSGMSFQEKAAAEGVPPTRDLRARRWCSCS